MLGLASESSSRPAAKRVGVGGGSEATERMDKFVNTWDKLVGEGEHVKSVLEVMREEIVDVQYRLRDVEHCVYYAWDVKLPTPIADMAKEWTAKWQAAVKVNQGLAKDDRVNVGHVKNYVFMGMLNAFLLDKNVNVDAQKLVTELVLSLVGDDNGKIVDTKVQKLDQLVAMCNVKIVDKAKKCYVNMKVRESHPQLMEALRAWLDGAGERQLDPPPLKPRTQTLRKSQRA